MSAPEQVDAPGATQSDALAALEREAQRVDAELGGAAPGEQPEATERPLIDQSAVDENAAIFSAIIGLLTPIMPYLPAAYTPEAVDSIARAFTAVEVKRGWNLSGLLSAEAALAIAVVPPTALAVQMGIEHVKQQRIERARQRDRAERERSTWVNPMESSTTGAPPI